MAFRLLKRRDTGWIDITTRVAGRVSGSAHLRRVGDTVWLRFNELVVEDGPSSWATLTSLIPTGFRFTESGFTYIALPAAASSIYTAGPFRTERSGSAIVYHAQGGKRIVGLVSWPTDETMPTGGA